MGFNKALKWSLKRLFSTLQIRNYLNALNWKNTEKLYSAKPLFDAKISLNLGIFNYLNWSIVCQLYLAFFLINGSKHFFSQIREFETNSSNEYLLTTFLWKSVKLIKLKHLVFNKSRQFFLVHQNIIW